MKTYTYNSESLRFEPVSKVKRNAFNILVCIVLLLASFKPSTSTNIESEYITISNEKESFTEAKFKSLLYKLKVKHPDIVWAQSQIESANYTSPIFIENHNMLGLKLSSTRPTTAIGVNRGHAAFDNWQGCVIDYSIWQSTFTRGLTREQYFKYLGAVYAEDPNYEIKIRNKVKQFKR